MRLVETTGCDAEVAAVFKRPAYLAWCCVHIAFQCTNAAEGSTGHAGSERNRIARQGAGDSIDCTFEYIEGLATDAVAVIGVNER